MYFKRLLDMYTHVKAMSMAHWVGISSILLSSILFFIDIGLAVYPLAGFVALSLAAPFFPGFGYYMPVISCNRDCDWGISLTFDDGPDPYTTVPLLDLLGRHQIKAAFFVTGKRVASYPDLVMKILEDGHEIGNHTYSHDNFLMMRDMKTIDREIEYANRELSHFSLRPLGFRPPVGITGPKLKPALERYGMYNVTFSCRGGDFGNRRIKNLSKRVLKKVRAGDIVLLHDIMPQDMWSEKGSCMGGREKHLACLLHEFELIIEGIREKGLEILPLSQLIGMPVHEELSS